MSIVISPDLVGRMAIRLGRAFNQGWAQNINRGVPWNWATCTDAIERGASSRKPIVVEAESRIKHVAQTYWDLSPTDAIVMFLDKRRDLIGDVRLHDDHLSVMLKDWKSLDNNQVWRVDRAINSLCCGKWQPLYHMPPLNWLTEVFQEVLPSETVVLDYSLRENEAGEKVLHIDVSGDTGFRKAMEAFNAKGGPARWHKMALK